MVNLTIFTWYAEVQATRKLHVARNYKLQRNGNFCKGTQVSKIIPEVKADARVVQQEKFTCFCRMSVMANLLCFGCFAAG